MPVKMKPTSVIVAEFGLKPNGKVQRFFQDTCYKEMDQYVPRRDGDLRTIVDLSNPQYIIYEMPYAKYQYRGMREDGTHVVNHYTTPGTGPYWDKRMWSMKQGKIIKDVQNMIRRGGK